MSNINELKLAKELIRYPSVTPVDAGAINFLRKKLKSLGFRCNSMARKLFIRVERQLGINQS